MNCKAIAFIHCLINTVGVVSAFMSTPTKRLAVSRPRHASAVTMDRNNSLQSSTRPKTIIERSRNILLSSPLASSKVFSGVSGTTENKDTSTPPASQSSSRQSKKESGLTTSMVQHHTAIKTSNIEMSVAFYSLLDFYPVAKFRSGPARAAWLEHCDDWDDEMEECRCEPIANVGIGGRIELIEVPENMLYRPEEVEEKGRVRKRAVDRINNPALLGWDHVCLDVTGPIQRQKKGLQTEESSTGADVGADSDQDENSTCMESSKKGGLKSWIDALNSRSKTKFGKDMRVALQPRVKLFGRERCEYAFIYDADGGLIELVNRLGMIHDDDDASTWDDMDDSRIVWRNG